MKKIIIACLLVVMATSQSFAAATSAVDFANKAKAVVAGKTSATTDNKPIGKLSTGVSAAFNVATTGYALISQHENGVKAFATAHDSTAIYSMTVTKVQLQQHLVLQAIAL